MQPKPVLAIDEYRDRVLGCWAGKNIGGTLGAPFEGRKQTLQLSFFEPVPSEPLPNDDLDLQIVWLRMLEDIGIRRPTLSDFARHWLRYLSDWPPDEYGFCLRNLDRGLRPPISGVFQNRDIDCMGAPIRSEIWACMAPADPQRAAALASRDAMLDHAGGEGVHGEMFWAAVQSAAFVERDPMALIEIGLRMIPLSSDVARAIREVVFCWRHGLDWGEARHRMAVLFSNPTLGGRPLGGGTGCAHPCLAAPNHGFTAIGWLYGRDFGDCLCKAVNRGYDTDCTGATLGALLGILHGAANLPERWRAPVGDGIVMSPQTSECGAPKDLHALTNRVVRLAGNWFEAGLTTVALGRERTTSASDRSRLSRNREALEILRGDDLHSAVESIDDLDIVLHYEGEPVLHPQLDKEIAVEVRCRGKPLPSPRIVIDGSVGWQVEPMENNRFRLRADRVSDRMPFRVSVHTGEREAEAGFMMLGPSEAEWPNMFWGVGRDPQTRKRIREDHALPPDPRDWPGISQRRSATS